MYIMSMAQKILSVEVTLPLLVWKEEDQFVAFTPALDLSSCGESQDTAVRNFSEAVDLFFETAVERNTLQDLLESLGWRLENKNWIPSSQPIDGRKFSVRVPLPEMHA